MWSFFKNSHYPNVKPLVTHFKYHFRLCKWRTERRGGCQQAAAQCAGNGADTNDICVTCYQMSSFQHWPNHVCPRVYGFGWDTGGGVVRFGRNISQFPASIPLASDWLVLHTKFHLNWIWMSQSFWQLSNF